MTWSDENIKERGNRILAIVDGDDKGRVMIRLVALIVCQLDRLNENIECLMEE